MAHEVQIDDEAIMAEFARYAGGAAAGEGEFIPGSDANPGAWCGMSEKVVLFMAFHLVPGWNVATDTQEQLAAAVGECLDRVFPGGPGSLDRWGPWAKLAFALGLVGLDAVDMETMQIKPIREPGPEPEPEPGQDETAPAGQFRTGE